ncbi:MAG: acyl-CoA dehydrogenase [Elusimicrobia bacterium]|nr:acyl-CoA dehydrogenase [Elusimicrobiota bacterium]
MIFEYDDLKKEIIDSSSKFAQEKLKPLRSLYDEKEDFPKELLKDFSEMGFFGISIPEKYGGLNGGITGLCLAIEEMSKIDAGLSLPVATSALGAIPIMLYADEKQRDKWLSKVACGEKLAAFALSEPEAGSDATAQKTTAVKNGDYYILNGVKHFCSSGDISDLYVVFASTNPSRGARGISAFVVEKGTEGFKIGKKEKKLGIKANATNELYFENCKVPSENILFSEGFGLFVLQETFDYSRPGVAAQAIGIAEGALAETIPYLKSRKQFGQSVSSFQAIGHILAELASKTEAAKALVYSLSSAMDKEFLSAFEAACKNGTVLREELKKISKKRWTKHSAMAKYLASETAFEVAQKCVNLCGGIGYMRDFPVEKFMRDAKVTEIYEGTNHIQKNEIAAQLIKEY